MTTSPFILLVGFIFPSLAGQAPEVRCNDNMLRGVPPLPCFVGKPLAGAPILARFGKQWASFRAWPNSGVKARHDESSRNKYGVQVTKLGAETLPNLTIHTHSFLNNLPWATKTYEP